SHLPVSSAACFSSLATPPSPFYPLSLHDALPIFLRRGRGAVPARGGALRGLVRAARAGAVRGADRRARAGTLQTRHGDRLPGERSEEHTSELQSLTNLVCPLLLPKHKHHTLTPHL